MDFVLSSIEFRELIGCSLLSFILGASVQLFLSEKYRIYPRVLLNLFCFVSGLLMYVLQLLTQTSFYYITVIFMIAFVVAVAMMALNVVSTDQTKPKLMSFFSFLSAGLLGIFIGMTAYKIAALLIVCIVIVNGLLYLGKQFYLDKQCQEVEVECFTQDGLDRVYKLLKIFNVDILKKSIQKEQSIKVRLHYKTSATTHHVLLKQLYTSKDIGLVVAQ